MSKKTKDGALAPDVEIGGAADHVVGQQRAVELAALAETEQKLEHEARLASFQHAGEPDQTAPETPSSKRFRLAAEHRYVISGRVYTLHKGSIVSALTHDMAAITASKAPLEALKE
jgi:hypothetical protein